MEYRKEKQMSRFENGIKVHAEVKGDDVCVQSSGSLKEKVVLINLIIATLAREHEVPFDELMKAVVCDGESLYQFLEEQGAFEKASYTEE